MKVIQVNNVNQALPLGVEYLLTTGVKKQSRAGKVLDSPCPVATVYANPCERVLFCPVRDANPFFHIMEALWVLAGRQDVEFLTQFNKRMAEFSDNGKTFHGAYGHRWRENFGFNQLHQIVEMLQRDPNDRRAVLQIWDCTRDLNMPKSKDIPCNNLVYFKIRNNDLLDITVICRSNDVVWGAYGANVVQFSILQEYMAARLGVQVGTYTQLSDSYHMYEPFWKKALDYRVVDPYSTGEVAPYSMIEHPDLFDNDLSEFFINPLFMGYRNTWFNKVAIPIFMAWVYYKKKDYKAALDLLAGCKATDWRLACEQWIQRRMSKTES